MVCNATFNNILVISRRSVLLMEEIDYPEKTTYLPQITDKLYVSKGKIEYSLMFNWNHIFYYLQSQCPPIRRDVLCKRYDRQCSSNKDCKHGTVY